jgi:hypothetical protein
MRAVVTLTALFVGVTVATAGYGLYAHLHHDKEAVAQIEAPIEIKINPESRVSASITGPWPPPARCGTAASIPLEILNQGFLTARLEAQLADVPPRGVSLELQPEPLTGVAEETRVLKITMAQPGPADVTIAFKAHDGASDLGGRDRIHVLMQCR